MYPYHPLPIKVYTACGIVCRNDTLSLCTRPSGTDVGCSLQPCLSGDLTPWGIVLPERDLSAPAGSASPHARRRLGGG